MARLVAVMGVPHNPFHYHLVSQPRSEWNEDTVRMVERGEMLREKLRKARPDALIMVGNDHFHQFFMDNMPSFVVGKMEVFDGIYYNEVREFNLPLCKIPGDVELSQRIIEEGYKKGVDFAFSNELKVDHSVVVPLMFVRPEMDLPIAPIMSNCVAPPIPPAERFHQVGRALRSIIDEIPDDKRIGVVVSGNLALDVGGPLQFAPHSMDQEFDDWAVDRIKAWDVKTLIEKATHDRMMEAGNVTHAFVNFILAMGLAEGLQCTHAEGMKRKGSTQPWLAWEPVAEGVA